MFLLTMKITQAKVIMECFYVKPFYSLTSLAMLNDHFGERQHRIDLLDQLSSCLSIRPGVHTTYVKPRG